MSAKAGRARIRHWKVVGDHPANVTGRASRKDCGHFSSGTGGIQARVVVPTDPAYQAEVDVDWSTGSNCSGTAYALQVRFWVPEGLPYF